MPGEITISYDHLPLGQFMIYTYIRIYYNISALILRHKALAIRMMALCTMLDHVNHVLYDLDSLPN